jgi:CheY-like chemotaxis protein
VLVVDDEENVRRLAAKILEECGYTVLNAADGAEGVKLFGALAEKVDLVLLDLMMPVLSGREAFHRMRALRPAVRVLLSSGFRHDARVHELMDAGVTGFVEKPYTFQSLSRAVWAALGGAAAPAGPATTGSA